MQDSMENVTLLDENASEKEGVISIPTLNKMRKTTSSKQERNTKAIYPYVDENDNLLYEVLRRTGRGEPFLIRSYDKNGVEKYNLQDDVELVPYNLPNIKTAIKENKIIWIVEGESKADTMNELGFVTTTCAFSGPCKWSPFYNKYLEGAKAVIVVADNDPKGEQFAEHTAESLLDNLKNIEVVVIRINEICSTIKNGGDIDDLIEKVGTEIVKTTLQTIEANFLNEETLDERDAM